MVEDVKQASKVEIKIGGMHCAMCAKAVENSLKKVPGIRDLTIYLVSEQASVVFDEKLAMAMGSVTVVTLSLLLKKDVPPAKARSFK